MSSNDYVPPSAEELVILAPFCPCRVCNQSWTQAILGFFSHNNCRECHGCLQSTFYNRDFVEVARQRKATGIVDTTISSSGF